MAKVHFVSGFDAPACNPMARGWDVVKDPGQVTCVVCQNIARKEKTAEADMEAEALQHAKDVDAVAELSAKLLNRADVIYRNFKIGRYGMDPHIVEHYKNARIVSDQVRALAVTLAEYLVARERL